MADYDNLTPKQMIKGCQLCLKNADVLFESGLILGSRERYGPAISLMILACEEAVKGLAIYNKFVKAGKFDIKPFFRSHPHKHGVIGAGFKLFKHSSKQKNRIFEEFKEYIVENPQVDVKQAAELAEKLRSLRTNEAMDKEPKTVGEADKKWWDERDQIKKDGFYVDFKNGKWQDPQDIGEQKFNETKEHAEIVIASLKGCRTLSINDYGSR